MGGDRQRLDQALDALAEVVREQIQRSLGPGDELAQSAVDFAVTGEAKLQAQVLTPGGAQVARPAWRCRIDGNAAALIPTAQGNTTELVAEHERPGEDRVANAPLEEPVPIGATEPDRGYADERVVRAGFGCRLLMEPERPVGVQAKGAHRGCFDARTRSMRLVRPRTACGPRGHAPRDGLATPSPCRARRPGRRPCRLLRSPNSACSSRRTGPGPERRP